MKRPLRDRHPRHPRFSSDAGVLRPDFGTMASRCRSNTPGPRTLSSRTPQRSFDSGRIREEVASSPEGLSFYSYVPRSALRAERHSLLVAVHGISRNARELVAHFAPHAEKHGFRVIAPHFGPEAFDDYQRLGRLGRGRRADHALDEVIDSFARTSGVEFDHQFFFGFSGGGQFVHRYAMAHPDRVSAVIAAAAGWYTTPDPRRRYPRGLRVAGTLPGIRLEPERFLRVPILTLVGDRDIERDSSVRVSPWIDREQGRSRVERAKRWTQLMRDAAERFGIDGRHEFAELPGAGHSFRDCVKAGLAERLFDFITRCGTPPRNRGRKMRKGGASS